MTAANTVETTNTGTQATGSSLRMSAGRFEARSRGTFQLNPSSAPRSPTLLAIVKMAMATNNVPVPRAWNRRPTASEKPNARSALAACPNIPNELPRKRSRSSDANPSVSCLGVETVVEAVTIRTVP